MPLPREKEDVAEDVTQASQNKIEAVDFDEQNPGLANKESRSPEDNVLRMEVPDKGKMVIYMCIRTNLKQPK
jgi:hypothetical protein